jgi:hypothetical protein
MNNRGLVQLVQKAARLVERAKKRGAPVEEDREEDGDREDENGEATIVVARPAKRAKVVLTVTRRSGRVLRK